ncbi:hypothetical protein IJ579_04725 [bacterium]|nr:hypothetical protein [bacterium]
MEYQISQIALNNGLTFLAIATGIVIIVVGGFLVKLLMDLSELTKNINTTSIILNEELKPTLKTLNKTISSFNEIIQNTGEGMGNMKIGFENAVSKTKLFSQNLFGGFLKGFMTVYSLFCKKK